MDSCIHLPVVGKTVLIFKLDDIKKLRELGIIGVLSGTLPKAPQQNIFLGVPLQLSLYEVIWLVKNKHAQLVDARPADRVVDEGMKLGTSINGRFLKNEFVEIPNTVDRYSREPLMDLASFIKSHCNGETELKQLIMNYNAFEHLKSMNFCILPGIRFGGEFIAYPGDPLRFHSHLIVNTKTSSLDVLDLIAGGRLATGVKKIWLLVGSETEDQFDDPVEVDDVFKESNLLIFSIEWSGFG